MTLTLRPMTLDDIPQVVAIDQQAFSTPWSARTYAYEVSESHNSHMLVIDTRTATRAESGTASDHHLPRSRSIIRLGERRMIQNARPSSEIAGNANRTQHWLDFLP